MELRGRGQHTKKKKERRALGVMPLSHDGAERLAFGWGSCMGIWLGVGVKALPWPSLLVMSSKWLRNA